MTQSPFADRADTGRHGLLHRMRVRRPPLSSVGHDPDYRFSLANERTFLAWIRTALALLAGGVAAVQLVPAFKFHAGTLILGVNLPVAGQRAGDAARPFPAYLGCWRPG